VWRQPARRFRLCVSKKISIIDHLPPADLCFPVVKSWSFQLNSKSIAD
jgi:hypothetical protein